MRCNLVDGKIHQLPGIGQKPVLLMSCLFVFFPGGEKELGEHSDCPLNKDGVTLPCFKEKVFGAGVALLLSCAAMQGVKTVANGLRVNHIDLALRVCGSLLWS